MVDVATGTAKNLFSVDVYQNLPVGRQPDQ